MAARTTTADGNVSNVTGTSLNGGTALGTTDTVVSSHNIHFNASTTFGSSPSTGGTAAFSMAGAVRQLYVDAGVALTVKGDIAFDTPGYFQNQVLNLAAGSVVTFVPPSGQQYGFTTPHNASGGYIIASGSSGGHITIQTDTSSGGLPGYMAHFSAEGGIRTATYVDFVDMGDSVNYGVLSRRGTYNGSQGPAAIYLTNCTFTRCSYGAIAAPSYGSGDFTFQDNKFYDSILTAYTGGSYSAFFLTNNTLADTLLIDSNSFDEIVGMHGFVASTWTITNNVFLNGFFSHGGFWSDEEQFAQNLIHWTEVDTSPQRILGSARDCIYVNSRPGANPHFLEFLNTASDTTYSGLIFWMTGSGGGAGDAILPKVGTRNLTVLGALVLPDADGLTSGNLISVSVGQNTQVAEHNTMCATGGECGLIRHNHVGESHDNQIVSCRSNLLVSYGTTTGCKAISTSSEGAAGVVDAVTDAGFNGFYNPTLNRTCKYNTSTVQADVTGYQGVEISANTPFPNTQCGHDDVIVTSDPIIDKTYTPNTWGAANGGTGVLANTLDLLFENPALIIAAGATALIPMLRAKWGVTGAAGLLLKDAGHDGVTIGAMEYSAGGSGSTAATLLAIGVI